jgi:hypothetical protein
MKVTRPRPPAFLKHPDPSFPPDHDEVAASRFVSGSVAAPCGCWVCQTVVLPRQRQAAAAAAAAAAATAAAAVAAVAGAAGSVRSCSAAVPAAAGSAAAGQGVEASAEPVSIVYLSAPLRTALVAEKEGRVGAGFESELCAVGEEDEFVDAAAPESE